VATKRLIVFHRLVVHDVERRKGHRTAMQKEINIEYSQNNFLVFPNQSRLATAGALRVMTLRAWSSTSHRDRVQEDVVGSERFQIEHAMFWVMWLIGDGVHEMEEEEMRKKGVSLTQMKTTVIDRCVRHDQRYRCCCCCCWCCRKRR
jgi:hypothetical protein